MLFLRFGYSAAGNRKRRLAVCKRKKQAKKKEFTVTCDELSKIEISSTPLYVSEIADRLNALVDQEKTKKITASAINNWLLSLNFLENIETSNGKTRKLPTAQGKEIGIFSEEREGQYGTYFALFFNSEAQLFIYDNVNAIIEHNRMVKAKSENQGKAWTDEQDAVLINLYQSGIPASAIAKELKRTRDGVCVRLKRLGLVEDRKDVK